MNEITFIHAADLHLDSPFIGLKSLPEQILKMIKEAPFLALKKVIDQAISRNVDFVLLAGDLYDGADRNLKTQVMLRKQMERLNEHGIQVYVIHGNHDHLDGNWVSIEQPENVHVFPSYFEMKQFTKKETTVNIYGYSYPSQHVKERIIHSYKKIVGANYHIGMLHGSVEGEKDHSPYAPFHLEELLEKDFDYWALGHIHKRQQLAISPPIIYPGNIQGRNKKEMGVKGCYQVTLNGKQASLEFIPTSPIVWEEMTLMIDEDDQFDQCLQKCRLAVESFQQASYHVLLRIKVINHSQYIRFEQFKEELLELLQLDEASSENNVYPYAIMLLEEQNNHIQHNPLISMLNNYEWTERDVNEAIQSLYKHPLGRKYISSLTIDEKQELVGEARKLLAIQLARGGMKY